MIARGLSLAKRLKSHRFVRQIGGMMVLTAVGQGLYVAAGPFIGRIYSPAEVGYFGLFVTIWTVLALFACGLYDLAIPAVHDDEEARRLSGASIVVGVAVSILAGCGLSVAVAGKWFGLGMFPLWVGAVMSAGMLAQMVVLIGQAWAVRRNDVIDIGHANVLMNGLRGVFQVVGGLLIPIWAMMAAGEILARFAQAGRLFRASGSRLTELFRWDNIFLVIRKHRSYPFVFGPAYALDAIATLLQTAMFGFLFGPAEMGQFFLMRRTLDLPVAFAFRSLSDLFFARQLTLAREDPAKLRPFFVRSSAMLAAAGVIGGAPLMIWGRELFQIFYGPNWGAAGVLAAFMVPALVANLAVAPVARVFQLSSRLYLRLLPGIVNVTGTILVIWFADRYDSSLMETTVAISIVMALHYLTYFVAGFAAAGSIRMSKLVEAG